MKTNKQKATQRVATIGIIALAAMIVISIIACKNDDGGNDPLCTCNPKEHYLPCTCGGTDCTCEVKPRGYITEYETNKQIPIYQTVGVTDAKAETATTSIIAGYNGVGNAGKQIIAGKVQEIRIVNGTSASCTPSGIVEIGADWQYDFEDIFTDIIKDAVTE